jgi:hypothetical protein
MSDMPFENKESAIAWIRGEMNATITVNAQEIVGWDSHLEPNPEMGVSEGTHSPVTRDRQHIIVQDPIYGEVEKKIQDCCRARKAAELLVKMVLEDESLVRTAKEILPASWSFRRYWEEIHDQAKEEGTRRIADWMLGRSPAQIAARRARGALKELGEILGWVGKIAAAILFYCGVIYLFWPDSRAGRWIEQRAWEIWYYLSTHS